MLAWIVEPIDNKIKIAICNHGGQNNINRIHGPLWSLKPIPILWLQNVHFTVMLDYVSDEIGSEQYTFVQNDLAKAASDPNIDGM